MPSPPSSSLGDENTGVAVPFGSSSVVGSDSDFHAPKRGRVAEKPSMSRPAKESPLRQLSYTGVPLPKMKSDAKRETDDVDRLLLLAQHDKNIHPMASCCRYDCTTTEKWS